MRFRPTPSTVLCLASSAAALLLPFTVVGLPASASAILGVSLLALQISDVRAHTVQLDVISSLNRN